MTKMLPRPDALTHLRRAGCRTFLTPQDGGCGKIRLLVFGINDGSTPPGLGDEIVVRNNQTLHLPVFDLTNFDADSYEAMGRETVDRFYSDHNHTYLPGAEFVASSIVSGLKAFEGSPFIPMLSEKGRAVETAGPQYASGNSAPAQ
jgi:hypothetical protein